MTDADPLLPYRFTVRQRQVLRGIGRGQTYEQIAAELGIARNTVKVHAAMLKARIGYQDVPAHAACRIFLRNLASD